jgi:hypothetical protein
MNDDVEIMKILDLEKGQSKDGGCQYRKITFEGFPKDHEGMFKWPMSWGVGPLTKWHVYGIQKGIEEGKGQQIPVPFASPTGEACSFVIGPEGVGFNVGTYGATFEKYQPILEIWYQAVN